MDSLFSQILQGNLIAELIIYEGSYTTGRLSCLSSKSLVFCVVYNEL